MVRLRKLWHRVAKKPDGLPPATAQLAEGTVRRLGLRANDIVTDWAELLTDSDRLTAGLGASVPAVDIAATVAWVTAQHAPASEVARNSDGRAIEGVDGRALREGDVGGCFDDHDEAVLLRLVQCKRGALANNDGRRIDYAHVAIDEAQDRSAIEVKVLLDTVDRDSNGGDRCSATIAGDTAQRLVFDNHFGGWQSLLDSTGYGDAVVQPLALSYRSTAEVMAFAQEILGPELAPEQPLYARAGAPVELHGFGDTGEAVSFLGDALRDLAGRERLASVALVARYPEQAEVYFEGLTLAEVPRLRRVRDGDFRFTPGIDVTDAAQVKGLEFGLRGLARR